MSLDIIVKSKDPNDHFNITHNVALMAKHVKFKQPDLLARVPRNLYELLWNAEDLGFNYMGWVAKYMPEAIRKLYRHANVYDKYNPINGWGSRHWLLEFCERLLIYAIKNPSQQFKVSK